MLEERTHRRGFEPLTARFVAGYSIRLSYQCKMNNEEKYKQFAYLLQEKCSNNVNQPLTLLMRHIAYLILILLSYLLIGLGSLAACLLLIFLFETAIRLPSNLPPYPPFPLTTQRGWLIILLTILSAGLFASFLAKFQLYPAAVQLIGLIYEVLEIGLLLLTALILTYYLFSHRLLLCNYFPSPHLFLIGAILLFLLAAGEEGQWGVSIKRHEWMPFGLNIEPLVGQFLISFAILYGAVLPFLSSSYPNIWRVAFSLRLPLIPLSFVPILLLAAILLHPTTTSYWNAPVNVDWELSEVGELLIYTIFCAAASLNVAWWRTVERELRIDVPIGQKEDR